MESETPTPRGVKCSNEKVADKTRQDFGAADPENSLVYEFTAGLEDAQDFDPFGGGATIEPGDLEPAAFPAKIPTIEAEQLCRRMAAYLRGWCANGIRWILAPEFKRRFAKRSGYSWRHVDDVFPQFQRYTTEFVFKRARLGRSTCILIHPKNRRHVLTLREARARLVGAIRSMAGKVRGRVGIGLDFLANFQRTTGLAPEHIFRAWQSLRRIDGLCAWWSGRKNGRKFYVEPVAKPDLGAGSAKNLPDSAAGFAGQVSHPENCRGISPLRGNRSENRAAFAAKRSPDEKSGSLRSQSFGVGEGTARPVGPHEPNENASDTAERSGCTSGEDVQTAPTCAAPPRGPCKPAFDARGSGAASGDSPENVHRGRPDSPANFRWKPALEPLHVCNRWLAPRKIRGKANFLAFVILQNMHADFPRVRFRPIHARNFAEDALRAGYLDSEICAAYRLGLDETQNSAAADVEHGERRDYWEAREQQRAGKLGMREPSQAVARAWLRLRADERSDAERWAAIFARSPAPMPRPAARSSGGENAAAGSPRSPRGETAAGSSSARENSSRETPAVVTAARPAVAAETPREDLPAPSPGLVRAHRDEHATFEQYLAACGVTLLELLKQPRAAQAEFVKGMRAWKATRQKK